MQKLLLAVLSITLFSINSNGQITKRNWLVGGDFNYYKSKSNLSSSDKVRQFSLFPTIGYFIFDKAAVGLRSAFISNKEFSLMPTGTVISVTQTKIGVGPFIRYYFLPVDKQINLFGEANMIYKNNSSTATSERAIEVTYGIIGGVAFFLNGSVGVELTAGYDYINLVSTKSKADIFKIGIGFQIHLEKDKY